MGRPKVYGNCRICGTDGKLSFEHVPPEKAFNNAPAMRYKMDEYLRTQGDFASMRGEKRQRGVGEFTLCEPCNNTGHWYGTEYVEWAKLGFDILDRVPPGEPPFEVTVRERYPLRFIKQIVTMIFSVNTLGFNDAHPELVRFVLDPKRKYLPPQYQVYLTIVGGPYSRSSGITGLQDGFGTGRSTVQVVTEVGYPPLASLLLIGEKRRDGLGCITHFADCSIGCRTPTRPARTARFPCSGREGQQRHREPPSLDGFRIAVRTRPRSPLRCALSATSARPGTLAGGSPRSRLLIATCITT